MKRLLIFALLAALILPTFGQDETKVQLANLLRPRMNIYAFNLNQNLRTTDSPTFAGITLSGSTASTLAYLNASKKFTSLANGSGYLLNDGSGGLSWAAVSLSGYLKADGTVPLTADWNVGAFDLTAVDMTATNFKLSGVGTLTSALGNVSLTTALTAASGDEVGFYLPLTVNKAAGNYTALKVNATETSAPGINDLLMDLQVGGVSQFSVANNGTIRSVGNAVFQTSKNFSFDLQADLSSGNAYTFSAQSSRELIDTDGSQAWLYIGPNINQSGTAGYQALKIDVTETALGSGATGANSLIQAQVGSVDRFRISNKGFETRAYPLACTHDTATALFGIAVTAGNTAGGVITYTLNVTDDDGSDDQIEVGTVQFVGLQDEANWHTNISEVSTQAVESGTLATTWAIDTATANTLKVTLQATSNLTSPVYTLSYTVTFNNSYTVTTY